MTLPEGLAAAIALFRMRYTATTATPVTIAATITPKTTSDKLF